MRLLVSFLAILFFSSCSTTHIYIVRHAEKAAPDNTMTTDVPLSESGRERATALMEVLKNKNISHIYSTKYIRTKETVQPLATAKGLVIETYDSGDTSFVSRLKIINHQVVVAGHSNTVDNLVNGLTGKTILKDLPDSQYGDLFIVKKKGRRYYFEQSHFGK